MPRAELTVVPAGAADLEDVARLMIAFRDWWERDTPGDEAFRRNCRALLADPDTTFLLATADDRPPCGVVQLRFRRSIWSDGWDCLLEDLFVEAGARGLGAGRRLLAAAIAHAEQRGARRIELDVNDANGPALALYRSVGFTARSEPLGGENLMLRRQLAGPA